MAKRKDNRQDNHYQRSLEDIVRLLRALRDEGAHAMDLKDRRIRVEERKAKALGHAVALIRYTVLLAPSIQPIVEPEPHVGLDLQPPLKMTGPARRKVSKTIVELRREGLSYGIIAQHLPILPSLDGAKKGDAH